MVVVTERNGVRIYKTLLVLRCTKIELDLPDKMLARA
jgi:hypothetical protein